MTMSSKSSRVTLGHNNQPSCNTLVPVQRNSFLTQHLLPRWSCSLALLSQEDALESFKGNFCHLSDALGTDLLDYNRCTPDPQLIRSIVSQVEFYLSDENLAKDAFLLKHIQKNKMGFISIKLLTSFKKVKCLTRDWRLTLHALKFSKLLEVNREGTKVRRRVPVPETLLNFSPSKLLLAWELQPQEQDMLLEPFQGNFLETIIKMFSSFGAIASIRVLRPGRKLPSDMHKYTLQFPELLSRCCALVEYESLESSHRALQALSHHGFPSSESIRVVQVCEKKAKKKPVAKRKMVKELVDQPGWKVQAEAVTFPYGIGDSLLCSSPRSDDDPESLSPLLNKEPVAPTWPGRDLKPRNFNTFTGSLFTSKLFPPLGMGLGTSSCHSLCGSLESPGSGSWGSGVGAHAPWCSSPCPDAKPPPSNLLALKWDSEPLNLQDEVLHLAPQP